MPKYQVNDIVKCLAERWDLEPGDEGYDATADKFSDTHFEEHRSCRRGLGYYQRGFEGQRGE